MSLFRNRQDAAQQLAQALVKYRGKRPLVLAIPRGAVPMGKLIASSLGGELDVVLVRKLRAPGNPELALGAIDEGGNVFLGAYAQTRPGLDRYLACEKEAELEVLRARRALYTPVRQPIDPAGRIVIVLDDGIATGSTMIAALRATRKKAPARLIAATAVAPADTLARIAQEADEVVCLAAPEDFFAIGPFFDDFRQVADDEVVELLKAEPAQDQARTEQGARA
jgi:predicted phosphoribosyltransferase